MSRFSHMQMLAACTVVIDRCVTADLATVGRRDLTQSNRFRTWLVARSVRLAPEIACNHGTLWSLALKDILEVSKEILETRRRHESRVITGVTGYLTARAVSTMFMGLSVQRKELTDDE
ncbi:MAG: hypothetical protein H8E44_32005 [Planctomycetes bacterium]|nr:hypothetical protein [Planctomycetota bacterium]